MIDDNTRERAGKSLHEARQHRYVLEKLLPDPGCGDQPVALHACLAVRKMLEAVLSLTSIRYRETQDLSELIDLIRENIPGLPEELNEVQRLSPLAHTQDASLLEPPRLDRRRLLHCFREIQRWADSARDSLDPEGKRMREEIAQNRRLSKKILGLRMSEDEET